MTILGKRRCALDFNFQINFSTQIAVTVTNWNLTGKNLLGAQVRNPGRYTLMLKYRRTTRVSHSPVAERSEADQFFPRSTGPVPKLS